MDISKRDKLLFLRLISDICPNSPSLDICSKVSESGYVIMKPHDMIITNAIDNKDAGVIIVSGEAGLGKTYGIGYYLSYAHFKGYEERSTAIYSTLCRENGKIGLKIKLSKLDIQGKSVNNLKEFFRFLNSLKSNVYGTSMFTHLVIDDVNDVESIVKIVEAYRNSITFYKGRPVLKVYILTRLGRKKIVKGLRGLSLRGPYSFNTFNSYQRENSYLCKFLTDDRYKVVICRMSYDNFSYFYFLRDLLYKLAPESSFEESPLQMNNEILGWLNVLSHIKPSLITERLRELVVKIDDLRYCKELEELMRLVHDYPYTLAKYYSYIPYRTILHNLYELSKRILKLFVEKSSNTGWSLVPMSVAINQSTKIPLDYFVSGNEVFVLAYVQRIKDVGYVISKARQLYSDLTSEKNLRGITVNSVLMYPKRMKGVEAEIRRNTSLSKGKSDQTGAIKVQGIPLSKKDIVYLVKGLVPYS